MKTQKPIKGIRRLQLPSCVLPQIRSMIEKDAIKFNVSKSWVIAVILAEYYNIKRQQKF